VRGLGGHLLGDDVVAISSTARNFKAGWASTLSQVYLGSPYTVAASAVAGHIADPREDAGVKAWVFGDNLDTDMLAPGRYMKFPIEEIAKHCLEICFSKILF